MHAIRLSGCGQYYGGKSSPWWYDPAQFHELLYASGTTPVRELVANLDGCTGAKAGEIVACAGLARAICAGVTRHQADRLLQIARDNARQVNPDRLGSVGPEVWPDRAYARTTGFATIAQNTSVPYVVEVWAKPAKETCLFAYVNRTPVTGAINAARDKRDINAFGCGLRHTIAEAPKDAQFNIALNTTTPFMPITSDGKAPNMQPFLDGIAEATAKAVRKAHRPNAGNRKSQKDVILDNLDDAIAKVSGDGQFRFNQRQILYALRPIVREETGKDLTTANCTAIITDYEAEHGEIPLMYREPRGSFYHPHRQETITLGTLMVESYERPAWLYNKLVYIEKEGFAEALKAVRWAERHDCALMSSKGFTTRAARDLVDKLAEHDEPVTIFCVHDAGASGTMMYQNFQEETKARSARKIKIINLGLDPGEAIHMGLEVETIEETERYRAVAEYARDWEEWLQTRRVELNAMTTQQFIEWLDSKMGAHGNGKRIPPADMLENELAGRIEAKIRTAITERILREAALDDQVAAAIAAIEKQDAATLEQGIRRLFKREPNREWRDHIEVV